MRTAAPRCAVQPCTRHAHGARSRYRYRRVSPSLLQLPGVRVFGGAIPTLEGLRAVLAHVGAAPDATPINGRQVRADHAERAEHAGPACACAYFVYEVASSRAYEHTGIRWCMHRLWAKKDRNQWKGQTHPVADPLCRPVLLQAAAVWHMMREEPVVYINGRPFVLREVREKLSSGATALSS